MTIASKKTKYTHLHDMAPLLIQVELTEACNLRCRFCYNSQEPRYNRHAIEILERLAGQGVMQLTLTGGEPLLHPEFFNILRRATELFPNVMILSNGTRMDSECVTQLHEYNILSVSISLHGDTATHDALTGVAGSHALSMRAICDFLERDTIPIASNYVLNAVNASHLPAAIHTLEKMGLRFMTITRFVPVGVGMGAADLALTKRQLEDAFRTIHAHRQRGGSPHIEVAEATPFCSLPCELRYLANTCSYGYDRFYVDVDGNLIVCGLSRIPLGGNVLESSIKEIKSASKVFHSFMEDTHLPEECTTCGDLDLCHGGCRAAAMSCGNWQCTRDCFMETSSGT
jgi:radical SAM protein with 4Fe4S-binding SPASM domain